MNWFRQIYHSKWFPRIFYRKFDGGKESGVTGYMLIEWKALFSVGVLHFKKGSREAFHNHAFHAITWWLRGKVTEVQRSGEKKDFSPSFNPKVTKRKCSHKVVAHRDTWAITFRGPWANTWNEWRKDEEITLTHGRKVVESVTAQ